MKIAILGSSKRFDVLCDKFIEDGFYVENFKDSSTLPHKLNFDLIIFPIPTLNKDGFINFKDGSKLSPLNLLKQIKKDAIIVACNFDNENFNIIDINKREDFAYLNAIPTAEAAIVIALQNLGSTIYKSKCLVTGFGRIGKMLSAKLKSLGADVAVSARNPKDLAYIEALGLKAISSSRLKENLSEYDIVFQTVPSQILTEDLLKKQTKKPLLVELSSQCAGTDIKAAENLGFKTVDGTNLPEKYMPKTAGRILYDVIIRILADEKGEI